MQYNYCMIDNLINLGLKAIGSVATNEEIEENGMIYYKNKYNSIFKFDDFEDTKQFIGNDFEILDKYDFVDRLIMEKIFKEYPFLVLLKQEINLPFPNNMYYLESKDMIIEYEKSCYVIKPTSIK